ncbi:unnamed protein product [Linum tenue]|uniref:Uncharacterized protein n=1 Tax=Linum tenue TaxID=586396 RepID=A0AAV0J0H0_9ROSI|nr:unnamed protein product [Linum tenue]
MTLNRRLPLKMKDFWVLVRSRKEDKGQKSLAIELFRRCQQNLGRGETLTTTTLSQKERF